MSGWEKLSEKTAGEIWNTNLVRVAEFSPFQTFEQGQLEKSAGWIPQYWIFLDDLGNVKTMFLGLLRRYPFRTGLINCLGGPAGDISNFDGAIRSKILELENLKRLYVRIRWEREHRSNDILLLRSKNWQRSIFSMTSGLSMELDISRTSGEISSSFAGKWRRNLRLALKNEMSVERCSDPDIEEIRRVFREMESAKGLPVLFSLEKLKNIFEISRPNLVFIQCKDASGNLLAFRAALVIEDRACDFFAATSEKGRKLRASYRLFNELVKHLQEIGISKYDMGGIDPWANPDVFRFKKETGAREVEFLGEWDWATSDWLRLLGNWAIYKRHDLKGSEWFKFPRKKKELANVLVPLPAKRIEVSDLLN